MKDLSLRFENFLCPLFNSQKIEVNGEIRPNERVVLRGPSGCGKSTLLKYIAGLWVAEKGKIYLGNESLRLDQPQISRPGFLFQGGALFEHLSVMDNCLLALRHNPHFLSHSKELQSQHILSFLSEVECSSLSERLCQNLSGGEKQRVALIQCLLLGPRFLLLDEPLSALDPELKTKSQNLILNLLAKTKLPALIVTHDEAEAKVLGTKILDFPRSSDPLLRLHF